jgi:hypothetical protein
MQHDWILLVGHRLSELGLEGDPVQLGIALFALWAKGIPGAPPEGGWAGTKPGSPAWEWAYTISKARPSANVTLARAILHEVYSAEAEMQSESIPVLPHDRRQDGQPLHDPDLPEQLEPLPRRPKAGRPLLGLDPLVAIDGLAERGFKFPPGVLRDGELDTVHAFVTRSDEELEAEWGVTPAALWQRRSRLRKRMSELELLVEGGFMDAPTLVERLAYVEERVREHDRQLGLVPYAEAASAVETLIEDVQADDLEGDQG